MSTQSDTLFAVLCECDPVKTADEFAIIRKRFFPEFVPPELTTTALQALYERLAAGSFASAGRPDLQLLFQHLYILLFLHLVPSYRVYWLQKRPSRGMRLGELIRAISRGLEMLVLKEKVDDKKSAQYKCGVVEFVQSMREVYATGLAFFGNRIVSFESLIARDEAKHQYEKDQPFRTYVGQRLNLERPESAVLPFERRIYIGNLPKADLVRGLLAKDPRPVDRSVELKAADYEEIVSIGKMTAGDAYQGYHLYVDIFRHDYVDPAPHDEVCGRGSFKLIVTRVREFCKNRQS